MSGKSHNKKLYGNGEKKNQRKVGRHCGQKLKFNLKFKPKQTKQHNNNNNNKIVTTSSTLSTSAVADNVIIAIKA